LSGFACDAVKDATDFEEGAACSAKSCNEHMKRVKQTMKMGTLKDIKAFSVDYKNVFIK
jgi:hypothetical protein